MIRLPKPVNSFRHCQRQKRPLNLLSCDMAMCNNRVKKIWGLGLFSPNFSAFLPALQLLLPHSHFEKFLGQSSLNGVTEIDDCLYSHWVCGITCVGKKPDTDMYSYLPNK